MIQNFIVPAMWGLLLLFSFIGYGCFLRRVLFRSEQFGWANEAAWGMALVIMLGGVLTFARLISSNLLDFLLLTGVLLMGLDKLPSAPRKIKSLFKQLRDLAIADTVRLSLYLFVFALTAIQYLHSINLMPPSIGDDLTTYFALPKQMLELGGFNVDPFDFNRLSTGLGGQSILLSLMLANSDFNDLMLVDGGVSLLICVGLILRICSQRNLNTAWSIVIVFFFLCLPLDLMRINNSSLATGMVMLFALFAFLDRNVFDDSTPIRDAFIVGLLASGACALKTVLIPPLVLSLAFSYSWHIYATRFNRQALLEAALVPMFVLLMLLPWMLSLKHTSGTMLYPIFGSGFAESNYGSYVSSAFSGGLAFKEKWDVILHHFFLKSPGSIAYSMRGLYLPLVATGTIAYLMVKIRRRCMTHAYIFGTLIGSLTILLNWDLTNTYPHIRFTVEPLVRYTFAFTSVALLVTFLELASYASGQYGVKKPALSQAGHLRLLTENWRGKFTLFTIVAVLISFFWYFNHGAKAWEAYQGWFTDLSGKNEKVEVIPEAEYSRHRNAQVAVPAGEAIFSSDLYTLLYDYSRNRIFNASVPGGASPPPGMPYFQGPEAVATYLLNNGIRYAAYHYKSKDGDPVLANLWRLNPARPYIHRALTRSKFALDQVLGELGHSRSRIFDDGTMFIIDLKSPSKVADKYLEPNYFELGKILTPAWATTRGLDSRKLWTDGHAEISNIYYILVPGDNVLALNTFGYIPWRDDLDRLNLTLAVNGKVLPMIARSRNFNSYYFSLQSITEPITNITINSNTFDPRRENQFSLKNYFKDEPVLGIDVDTIQILGLH